MKTIFLIITVIYALCPLNAYCQNQETQVFAYNIALGGITSGIGAAINKKKEDKLFPVFLKGFKLGCIGGFFLYGGKKISYQINHKKQLIWAWPSKLIHSYGATIMENASRNEKDIFSKLSFPVGFIRLNFSLKEAKKVNVQLQPGSLASFCFNLTVSNLNLKESILMGTPVFLYTNGLSNNYGYALINTISYLDTQNTDRTKILVHEHIHMLQEREYLILNTWANKPVKNTINKLKKPYKKISMFLYPDIPYNYLFYTFMRQESNCYYKNFFEFEAERFATNKYVKKCY